MSKTIIRKGFGGRIKNSLIVLEWFPYPRKHPVANEINYPRIPDLLLGPIATIETI